MANRSAFFTAILLGMAIPVAALTPPSVPEVDAPQLAALGASAVGVRTLHLLHPAQPDVLAADVKTGAVPMRDRAIDVDLFYPAVASRSAAFTHQASRAKPVTYRDAMSAEPPLPPATFTVPGIARRDAGFAPGKYPLVLVSHGYGNVTAALSWLTENLASKGYVVAAIRHADPDIADRSKFAGPLLNRPLDIAFVAAQLQKQWPDLIDATRTAVIGYSMGGYGALTAAGASIDPMAPAVAFMPGKALGAFARGGPRNAELRIAGLRAVVAISPAGGAPLSVWGSDGLADIKVPMLLICGNRDTVVGYTGGAQAFFAAATASDRYLLTFREAGHAIGLNPAPPEMQSTLWDYNWFEDAVWRKRRINAVNQHFITAFLGRNLQNDETLGSYLDVGVVNADEGVWPTTPGAPDSKPRYAGYSPGTGNITVWKGFQKSQVQGLELRHAPIVKP